MHDLHGLLRRILVLHIEIHVGFARIDLGHLPRLVVGVVGNRGDGHFARRNLFPVREIAVGGNQHLGGRSGLRSDQQILHGAVFRFAVLLDRTPGGQVGDVVPVVLQSDAQPEALSQAGNGAPGNGHLDRHVAVGQFDRLAVRADARPRGHRLRPVPAAGERFARPGEDRRIVGRRSARIVPEHSLEQDVRAVVRPRRIAHARRRTALAVEGHVGIQIEVHDLHGLLHFRIFEVDIDIGGSGIDLQPAAGRIEGVGGNRGRHQLVGGNRVPVREVAVHDDEGLGPRRLFGLRPVAREVGTRFGIVDDAAGSEERQRQHQRHSRKELSFHNRFTF